MIVWSGRGFVVLLIVIAAFLTTNVAVDAAFAVRGYSNSHSWPGMAALWIAAAAVLLLKPAIAGKGRVLTDKVTGQDVVINKAGSLFFISYRSWPIVLFVLGAAWGLFRSGAGR